MCFGRYMKRLSQKQNMHSFCNKPTFGAVPQTAPGPFAVQKASDTGLGKEHIGLCSGEDGRWRENICFVMG